MKYGLEINSVTCGETSAVAVDAEGAMEDGVLNLAYRFDGADYTLTIDGAGITHERKGGVNIFMRLTEGSRSFCRINDENGEGVMEIETSGIYVTFDGLSCKAECLYRYRGEEEEIRLTVFARAMA